MIWYLLFPFRGTTDPPELTPEHPIRRLFYSHGSSTARHWLPSILISVAIAVILCYPVLYIYDSPTADSYKPHHVWTSVTKHDNINQKVADVEIRQAWIHGSYMGALEGNVLQEALAIQTGLMADDPSLAVADEVQLCQQGDCCGSLNARDSSWGFHSPLMYWNCSSQLIHDDLDKVATVNKEATRQSFQNVTLRPTSVFAGKYFSGKRLIAADAIVLTLYHRSDHEVGRAWDRRARQLAQSNAARWTFYPATGFTSRNQVYEFHFQQMTLREDLYLAMAYTVMIIYVIVSVSRLRAVKSQLGLLVTALLQAAVSIVAGITICGILRINLSQVPKEAFPFVVLVIGFENMFRLINAVLLTPPEMSSMHRIANALGDVGHLSLVATLQNLALLWLLSRIVISGVAAFCAFAAVALVFDFIFHLIFFVPVLSVEVRRLELQDSIDKTNAMSVRSKSPKPARQNWKRGSIFRRIPFSTRIAGTAAMLSFVIALNGHFFQTDSWKISILRKIGVSHPLRPPATYTPAPAPPPMNQTRTPLAWFRMQDLHTAKEAMQVAKPHSNRLVARVFDPLIVVLVEADRSGAAKHIPSFLLALRDLAEEHFFPFALAVVFTIAFVTLVMNYLLWSGIPDKESDMEGADEDIPEIRTLQIAHKIDVIQLDASTKGHLFSASLDRTCIVWTLDWPSNTYMYKTLRSSVPQTPLWPILNTKSDDAGTWLAISSTDGRIGFWNMPENRLSTLLSMDNERGSPICSTFVKLEDDDDPYKTSFVILYTTGHLLEINPATATAKSHILSSKRLQKATAMNTSKSQVFILAITHDAQLRLTSIAASDNGSIAVESFDQTNSPAPLDVSHLKHIIAARSLGVFLCLQPSSVSLYDPHQQKILHHFGISKPKDNTIRLLHSAKRHCQTCGSLAVHSLSLIFTEAETGDLSMQTFTLTDGPSSLICLQDNFRQKDTRCSGLAEAQRSVVRIQNPGTWEVTGTQAVIGVRPYINPANAEGDDASSITRPYLLPLRVLSNSYGANWALRHRKTCKPNGRLHQHLYTIRGTPSSHTETNEWEAWTLSASGEFKTTYFIPGAELMDNQTAGFQNSDELFVSQAGPMVRVGKRGVAVALGNKIRVITVGGDRFEEEDNAYYDADVTHSASRKRRWRMA